MKSRRLAALACALAMAVSGVVATVGPTVASAEDTGTNVALTSNGSTVSASGNEVSDGRWTYQMGVDGDLNSRWSSNHSDQAWIQVKLAEPTIVDHVNIHWEAACAAAYKLQVSQDGAAWTDATDIIRPTCPTQGASSLDTQSFNAATAATAWNYVRMQASERTPIGGSKWGVSLYEFEVWNGAEPTPPPPASGNVNLVPLPVQLTEDDGDPFVLNADTAVVASGDAVGVATVFAEDLRAATATTRRTSTATSWPMPPRARSRSSPRSTCPATRAPCCTPSRS